MSYVEVLRPGRLLYIRCEFRDNGTLVKDLLAPAGGSVESKRSH